MVVEVKRVAAELRRIATLADRLAERPGGERPHRELTQIANRLARVGDTLEKSISAGRGINARQIGSIATNLEAISAALRKNA